MKFLIALSLLVTTAAFAQPQPDYGKVYKCWDTAQGSRGYPTYVFKSRYEQPGFIRFQLEYPRELAGFFFKHGCWISLGNPDRMSVTNNDEKFKVCLGEGQHIDGLIPIEIEEEFFEGTVYCEREFKKIFKQEGPGTL